MSEEIIVGSEGLDITDKEEQELIDAMGVFVNPTTKKFLLKNFNYEDYKSKRLERYEFAMTVFWALARDRVIDFVNDELVVEWRTWKHKKYRPRLVYLRQVDKGYLFTIRFFRGIGEKSQKPIYTTSKILITTEEYENFKKEYANEIKELEKQYTNQC